MYCHLKISHIPIIYESYSFSLNPSINPSFTVAVAQGGFPPPGLQGQGIHPQAAASFAARPRPRPPLSAAEGRAERRGGHVEPEAVAVGATEQQLLRPC